MTKKLIICLDGTWNTEKVENKQSNVYLMSRLLVDSGNQEVHYFRGVGTKNSDSKTTVGIAKYYFHKLVGGYAGYGISENIRNAYEIITEKYVEGTAIYLFGFSRGAFTARSLSGFMDEVGVLDKLMRNNYHVMYQRNLIDDAYNYYRLPDVESKNISNRMICRIYFGATCKEKFFIKYRSPEESIYTKLSFSEILLGLTEGRARWEIARLAGMNLEIDMNSIHVEVLGVWDTVCALGAKTKFMQRLTEPLTSFHNANISDNVTRAYQALALHELRALFLPRIWLARGSRCSDLEQVWFTGSHSNVGGGSATIELSNIALQWMIDKVTYSKSGEALKFKQTVGDQCKPLCACNADIEHSRSFKYKINVAVNRLSYIPEEINKDVITNMYIHPCALCRSKSPIYSDNPKYKNDIAVFRTIDDDIYDLNHYPNSTNNTYCKGARALL